MSRPRFRLILPGIVAIWSLSPLLLLPAVRAGLLAGLVGALVHGCC